MASVPGNIRILGPYWGSLRRSAGEHMHMEGAVGSQRAIAPGSQASHLPAPRLSSPQESKVVSVGCRDLGGEPSMGHDP